MIERIPGLQRNSRFISSRIENCFASDNSVVNDHGERTLPRHVEHCLA